MPQPGSLEKSLTSLANLSSRRRELLARLGLRTVGDLLFHFPRAYEDLTDVRPIVKLTAGTIQTVQGEVVEIDSRELTNGGFVVSVVISDDGQRGLEGVWFNQGGAAKRFRYGQRVSFSGKPRWYRDHWQMNTPRVQYLDEGPTDESSIVPIYPLTEDLRLEHLRPLVAQALDRHSAEVIDILPESLKQKHRWPAVGQALREVHQPATLESANHACGRFIYEEFLILQLALALRRREVRDRQRAPRLPVTQAIDTHIRRLFPFELTGDQNRAVSEICRDLAGERPMQRLLQADVGAGKTAVAAYALLVAVANKHQAALMAPTEVLARQHFGTLELYLAKSRVRRLLLTGGLSQRERREALDALRNGEIDLVIGTQALVQEDVEFARLGLVVIDEQHKFGVHQRARLRGQPGPAGLSDPHYLVMTATPIPRTMALTVFGDLDDTKMHELPPGRQAVVTRWVKPGQRDQVYTQLREGLDQGQQAFIICPLVEESDTLLAKAATQTHEELQAGPFRNYRLGLLHGRMDESAKAEVMDRFRAHRLDVLVATSVVEVGVDVPNATLLLIEHADRFGLSQLHQLRGRVSRGQIAGQCFLIAEPTTPEGEERLRTVVRTRDGFELAEADMRLRGAGEFFGSRQHGLGEFRFGDPSRDYALLGLARQDAFQIVLNDATLAKPEHALLRQAVLERYGQTLDLAAVG
jgi:ATP-dependent DNA helicase RecG